MVSHKGLDNTMTRGLIFWVLMLIWLVFGTWVAWGHHTEVGGNLLLWVLLALLGWQVFGAMVKG